MKPELFSQGREALRPIIVKKVIEAGHDAHHGGAWKIAYADFVTAMMAFFMLMWLLGMTDEQKRKGLADYFAPTLIEYRQESAGSNGILGGDSIIASGNYPNRMQQTGNRSIVVPHDATGGPSEATPNAPTPESRFVGVRESIEQAIRRDPGLRQMQDHVSLTMTADGLRIDLMDQARFSMFRLSTTTLEPEAMRLVRAVAGSLSGLDNRIIIRGHTDSRPYPRGAEVNNWTLSSSRAEVTRQTLLQSGIAASRIYRIEGAADREPLIAEAPFDPRNRRISITVMP